LWARQCWQSRTARVRLLRSRMPSMRWTSSGFRTGVALGVARMRHLSLSRLNHRYPRVQAHPEIVQGTTEFHHLITDSLLPQADAVLHDAAALDTTIDMLDAQPPLVERLVRPLL